MSIPTIDGVPITEFFPIQDGWTRWSEPLGKTVSVAVADRSRNAAYLAIKELRAKAREAGGGSHGRGPDGTLWRCDFANMQADPQTLRITADVVKHWSRPPARSEGSK